MNNELIAAIILYGILWGVYHYWGYSKTIQKVTANPEKYSKFTIAFCKRLSPLPRILVSFATAISAAIIAIIIAIIVLSIWNFFKNIP